MGAVYKLKKHIGSRAAISAGYREMLATEGDLIDLEAE